MTRTITTDIRDDLQTQASPNALLGFVTITHPNLSEAIRIVSDPLDYVVGGLTFIGCPFEFQLLPDADSAPKTTLRVQNVDRRIGEAIRQVTDRASVTLEARTSADFDLTAVPRVEKAGGSSVIYGFRRFDLIDVTVTPLEVSGTLMLRDYTQEPWPGKRATQSRCPGLFR